MKNKSNATNKERYGRGPIARKVIAAYRQHLAQKVINMADWREAKMNAESLQTSVISNSKLSEYDPLHWLYVFGQNQLSILVEQILVIPALRKLAYAYENAEDEYLPSGPPMSPLTYSYFFSWSTFDLCSSGAKKESFCTIVTDLCKFQKVDEGLTSLFETMQASRMGIYRHEGVSGKFVLLRELITNQEIKAISPAGYLGVQGEIWFARVLPPPIQSEVLDYSVVFTTPYVLGRYIPERGFYPLVENEWLAYFSRTLPKIKAETRELAYGLLMKYGLSRNYWNEYIFLSYRNYQNDMILLQGFPDIRASLPHADLA
ncbi:MAG: hypothetical protein HQL48_09110 [Gammaproteobacteria bacterium]|nr:hypothetical protein [Gammaproteobacteria bacterium]